MDADARAAERREDAGLVERARAEDPDAFGQLYDRWFERVHDLAYRITGESAAAADVAQDAFLSAWKSLPKLQDPEAFGGWLLRIARNGALDRRRREQRSNPYDAEAMAMIEGAGPSPASAPAGFRVEDRARAFDDPARAAEDADLSALVWESAAALGERDAELLDLSLRHGLTPAEVGEVVGLNRNAANQAVHRVRSRLKTAIEARVLWRSGEPVCVGLAGALERAHVDHFGADAVRVISAHAGKCAECQGRRDTRLEPSALFGAVPFLVVPMVLKMKVAHALEESGVPMDGSEAAASEGPPGDGGHGTPRKRRHKRGRQLAVVGSVAIVALVSVGLTAEEVDELPVIDVAANEVQIPTTTSTTLAPTTSTSTAVTPTTRAQQNVAPPTPPAMTRPTSPPPAATASISIVPSTTRDNYQFGTVKIIWSSTGGLRTVVNGANFNRTGASGNESVCPGTIGGRAICSVGRPATYTYTVTVYNAAGVVVAQKSATLTIT